MPTPSGHTRAIVASRVTGTSVYNPQGEKIGHVEDIVLDKMTDKVMFAVLGFGGFLGIGEKNVALSLPDIKFMRMADGTLVGFVTSTKKQLQDMPAFTPART